MSEIIRDTYVDKAQFEKELRKFYDTGIFSEELGDIILRMINGQLYSWKFIKYSGYWRDTMYCLAMENCITAINNKTYNLDTGSTAFGYYYATILNSFRTALNKLTRKQEIEDEFIDAEFTRLMRDYGEVYVKPNKDEDEFYEE